MPDTHLITYRRHAPMGHQRTPTEIAELEALYQSWRLATACPDLTERWMALRAARVPPTAILAELQDMVETLADLGIEARNP